MADGFIQVQGLNIDELKQALHEAPDLSFKFARQELARGGNRFKKRFIAERLSGSPGINWPNAKRAGGGMKTTVTGKSLSTLKLTARLSRWLTKHETGGTILPKSGQWLYLHAGQGGSRRIVARVRSVTIPARLGFKALFNAMTPQILDKTGDAVERAIRVSMERRVKALSSFITRLVA
jgi:hypothetical protein